MYQDDDGGDPATLGVAGAPCLVVPCMHRPATGRRSPSTRPPATLRQRPVQLRYPAVVQRQLVQAV